ncbi:zinc finger protein 823-like [Neocloeon triangulifer]|uniref:zinc finger protein 823-like n=1 Tax=Neocloeon triangulifer TaxID=2078957 RepID=UPI00286FAD43|nr:zinc finger protein 823-like [Neocloeon triangulifer]
MATHIVHLQQVEKTMNMQNDESIIISTTVPRIFLQRGISSIYKSVNPCQPHGATDLSTSTQPTNEAAPRLECKVCDKKFNHTDERNYFYHLNPKRCEFCSEIFECSSLFNRHKRWYCPNLPKKDKKIRQKWKCNSCSRFLLSLVNFKKHCKSARKCRKCGEAIACIGLVKVHRLHCPNPSKPKQKKIDQQEIISMSWLTCQFCQQFYSSENGHFGKTFINCRKCRQSFDCRGLCTQHEVQCCDYLNCKPCGKHFSTNVALKTHTVLRRCKYCTHASECYSKFRQHLCPETPMETKKIQEIPITPEEVSEVNPEKDEEEIIQIEYKVFKEEQIKECRFCQSVCNSVENFECHTRQTDCPRCGFPQPCNTLLAHHLDMCRFVKKQEHQFRCAECEQKFDKKHQLDSHQKRCHSNSRLGEKILDLLLGRAASETQRRVIENVLVKKEPVDVIEIE